MHKIFSNVFRNQSLFYSTIALSILCGIFYIVGSISTSFDYNSLILVLTYVFQIILIIGLGLAYFFRNRNIILTCMGGLMMVFLFNNIIELFYDFSNSPEDAIFTFIQIVLMFAFLGTHIVMNADSKPKPTVVMINQIIVILIVINTFVWDIFWMVNYPPISSILVFDIISFVSTLLAFVCLESRIDAYRERREEEAQAE